nr:MAG TPA: hypothetical protein [Caudoviricetes sp.]
MLHISLSKRFIFHLHILIPFSRKRLTYREINNYDKYLNSNKLN